MPSFARPHVRRLAARLLLLGVVAFWWGAVVLPNFLSLAVPSLVPSNAVPLDLQPDVEGSAANTFSAAMLVVLAGLALGNALAGLRRTSSLTGWAAVGGWAALAAAAAFLAREDSSADQSNAMRITSFGGIGEAVLGEELALGLGPFLWHAPVGLLIAAFVLVMAVFVRIGLRDPTVRALFVLGIAVWVFAVVLEAVNLVLFRDRWGPLEAFLEEMLEVGGALLLAASAALALFPRRAPSRTLGAVWRRLAAGSIVAAMLIGMAAVAFLFRAPLVDARWESGYDVFWVSVADQQSVAQEFRAPAAPLEVLSLRLANRDAQRKAGRALVRIMDAVDGRTLRERQAAVPPRDIPQWLDVRFPPLLVDEGGRLVVQVAADIEPLAALRIGAVKPDRYADGRLWINGAPTWPDQDLEFLVTGSVRPSMDKLQAIWRLLSTDWRWSALIVVMAVGSTLLLLIPAVLVTVALAGTFGKPGQRAEAP